MGHVVIIMQENISFDHYFGTFPGADGLPMKDGVPAVCNLDPQTGECVTPFHDPRDRNEGGPHSREAVLAQINGGKMDGFIAIAEAGPSAKCGYANANCPPPGRPLQGMRPCANVDVNCLPRSPRSVMGYHDSHEVPNYWAYAQNFVLQDHMFAPAASWSLPEHLFMVSGVVGRLPSPG